MEKQMDEEEIRAKHLADSKARAKKYLDDYDVKNAVASMLSDMEKREDTKPNKALYVLGIIVASNDDWNEARRFIEGFR